MARDTRKKFAASAAATRRCRSDHRLEVHVDETTGPGNDFYKYVNQKWINRAHIPAYESTYDVSNELEEKIRGQLLGLIRRMYSQPEPPRDPHIAAIRAFFKAGMHAQRHNDHMRTFRRLMTDFGCMKVPADFAKMLGTMIAGAVPTFLSVDLGRSLKDPDENVLRISPGFLGLPDASYYKGEAPGKMSTLHGYETLMLRIGRILEYEDLNKVVSLESHAAEIFDRAESEDPEMMTGRQLVRAYSFIPWASFWEGYGLTDWEPMNFLIYGPSWLAWLNRQFRILPAAEWALWFRAQLVLYFGAFLPRPIDQLYFQFFGRRLRGNREQMTQEYLLYFLAQSLLMVSLSKIYKECCLPNSHQREVNEFTQSILRSAKQRIDDVTWLSPLARRRTKAKIAAIDVSVAEVDSGAHYKVPTLSEVDMIFNALELAKANTVRNVHYAKHVELDLPVMDPVFEVNAHYYNSGNRLVIPGGITMPPFYIRAGAHLGWSYGGLGTVIGHEMLHAFDEEGKNYNERGVFGPWWSRADVAAYSRKTRALVRLFSNASFAGHPLNGKSTLSENIADLGGMAISLDALKRQIGAMDAEKKKECYRAFFLSYASSWRTKERRARTLYRLFTDVHSPAPIRVNLIVAHFQEWYDAFDVKPGDALYIDPKDRISIF